MLQYMPKSTYFKNKKDQTVLCSCCGKKIYKGYIVAGDNLGEDCFDDIYSVFQHEIKEGTSKANFFQIKQKHFDWIKSR